MRAWITREDRWYGLWQGECPPYWEKQWRIYCRPRGMPDQSCRHIMRFCPSLFKTMAMVRLRPGQHVEIDIPIEIKVKAGGGND